MGDFLEIFYVKDLKMVDVRKYEGLENGKHAWTFLGYDIVMQDKEGKAVSILASEETKYDFLKKMYGGKNYGKSRTQRNKCKNYSKSYYNRICFLWYYNHIYMFTYFRNRKLFFKSIYIKSSSRIIYYTSTYCINFSIFYCQETFCIFCSHTK